MPELTTLLELGGPLAVAGGAAYARKAHPAVYWSTVGLPVSVARFLTSYGSTMDACGLTVEPSRLRALAVRTTTRREVRPVPPRRGLMRPTSTGLRVRLRLAPGQEPVDVAASCERLRHAWGVHAVHVREIKPGVVELRLVGFDVLRDVKMPRRLGGGPLAVPVALREDATAFIRDYRTVPHELVLGATLSGKSMFLRNLVTGLAKQPVALVGIDCKRGVELAPFAPRLSALATDQSQAAELLPVLVKEMEDRYDLIKFRQGIAPSTPEEEITSDIWGLPEAVRPVPIVLFVDEVAELFLIAAALSFAHLHDLASAAGQDGWKAWAYPVSVDLLLVAAWRRLRSGEAKAAGWCWFLVALTASLGANVATAGLLDLDDVPAWLRIVVAGWPAVAFLGGTLLAHGGEDGGAEPTAAAEAEPERAAGEVEFSAAAAEPKLLAPSEPVSGSIAEPSAAAETEPLPPAEPRVPAPNLPAALVEHARKLADDHHQRTGEAIDTPTLRARLGVPAPLAEAVAAHLT